MLGSGKTSIAESCTIVNRNLAWASLTTSRRPARSCAYLILASLGASNPIIVDVIGGASLQAPIRSGQRNQFNAGFQQAFGKYLVVDADYLWKYTHNAYDFSAFGNTPIFFPIAWKNSKIDGPSVR